MAGKPGRSGRKPVRPQLTPALRALMAKQVLPEFVDEFGEVTNRKALMQKLVSLGLEGDTQALKLIYERLDGKVTDALELSGAEGAPLEIFIRRVEQPDADRND